jgi:hypothetical protein
MIIDTTVTLIQIHVIKGSPPGLLDRQPLQINLLEVSQIRPDNRGSLPPPAPPVLLHNFPALLFVLIVHGRKLAGFLALPVILIAQ